MTNRDREKYFELYSLDRQKVKSRLKKLVKQRKYVEVDEVLDLVRAELPAERVSLLGLIIESAPSAEIRAKYASRLTAFDSAQILARYITETSLSKKDVRRTLRLVRALKPRLDESTLDYLMSKALENGLIHQPEWKAFWREDFESRKQAGLDASKLSYATQMEYFRCANLDYTDMKLLANGGASAMAINIVMKREEYDVFEIPEICEAFWLRVDSVRNRCQDAVIRHLRKADTTAFFEAAPNLADALQDLCSDAETIDVAVEILRTGKLAEPGTFSRLTQQVIGTYLQEAGEVEDLSWNIVSIIVQADENGVDELFKQSKEQLEAISAELRSRVWLVKKCEDAFDEPFTFEQFEELRKSSTGEAVRAGIPVSTEHLRAALQAPEHERHARLV